MKIRLLKFCIFAILYLLQVSIVIAKPNKTIKPIVPEDRVIELLRKAQYKKLNNHLENLQKAYTANITTENNVHKAFYEFYRNNKTIGQNLSEWITQQPKSAMPYLARGVYRTKMGWETRGSNLAPETSDSQFSGMTSWFRLAKEDLNHAINIDPSLVEAYCYLIEIDMNEGSQKIPALYNQALKANPSSFIAREFYLHSQLPRWGGSYENMKKTIADTSQYYKTFPQLRVLEGRIDADLGELAAYNKDYNKAIKYYDAALANGDFWFYNQKKGVSLWYINDYNGAIDQFSRVIRDKPGYKEAWLMRAQSYKMLKQIPEALADINYAIDMEPNDDFTIAARGYIFLIYGNLKSALEDFRHAAILNPAESTYQQSITQTELLIGSQRSSD